MKTAQARLQEAQAAEHAKAERGRATEIRAVLERMKVAGQTFDDALAVLVGAGDEVHKAVDELHRLGCSSPSGQQVLSLGERAIRSAVGKTLWSRCVERVAPNEQMAFAYIVEQWATMIERRLGELQPQKEEAA